MAIVVFVGAVASGKTTMARILKSVAEKRGYVVKYVDININHGFAYLLTCLLVTLLSYKYVGNYYLTLKFNNQKLFCRYLWLLQLLDIFYMPIKYLSSIKLFIKWNKFFHQKYLLIIDEYYLNAIADYMYFTKFFCNCCCRNTFRKEVYKLFYNLALRVLLNSFKQEKTLIVYLRRSLLESIRGWMIREKTKIVDVKHITFRDVPTRALIDTLKQYFTTNVSYEEHFIKDLNESLKGMLRRWFLTSQY